MAKAKPRTRGQAGRPRGSIMPRTTEFRDRMMAACERHHFDIVEALVLQAKGQDPLLAELTAAENATMCNSARRMLVDFAFPRLKAVELENTTPVRVVIEDANEYAALLE